MLTGVETSMIGHGNAKLDVLERVPLFAGLPKRELKRIAAVADVIDIPAGRDLTVEGAPGHEFFILLEGSVVVRQGGEFVNVLQSGNYFGELALLADRPRSATVTTIEPSRLLVLTEVQFRQVFRDSSLLSARVLPEVARRLAA
jgi:CRP/FNR family cyclic AMP-dependent transcriptional regulator